MVGHSGFFILHVILTLPCFDSEFECRRDIR